MSNLQFSSRKIIFSTLFITILFTIIPSQAFAGFKMKAPLVTAKSGLIGHWTLDKKDINFTEGTVTDRSGSGTTGTMNGSIGASALTGGKVAQGLRFDGIDDDIQLSDISHTPANARSWGAWFQINGTSGGSHHGIISHYGAGAVGYQVLVVDDSFDLVCGVGDGAHKNPTAYTVSLNTWYHVMCTADGTTLRQYVNGVETATVAAGAISNPSNVLRIGNGSDVTTRYLNGIVDDVRIYNRTLTAAEVKTIYKQRSTIKTSAPLVTAKVGLIGHWTFDKRDVSGTTVTDKSTSGKNGTLGSGASITSGKLAQGISVNGTANGVFSVSGNSDFRFPSGSPYTIMAWVKTSGASSPVFCKGTADSPYANYIAYSGGSFSYNIGGSWESWVPDGGVISSTGLWQHMAWSLTAGTGSTMKFYLNGVEVAGSWTAGDGNGSPAVPDNALSIGSCITQQHLTGNIDDVRIYNRMLTAAEIGTISKQGTPITVNASLSPSTLASGLVGHWTMDGKHVNWGTQKLTDASGNGNTGTLVNTSTSSMPVFGVLGQALKFDGSNDYASIPLNLSGTNVVTLAFWYKRGSSLNDDKLAFEFTTDSDTTPGGFYFLPNWVVAGDLMRISLNGNVGRSAYSTTQPTTNKDGWHHYAAVYDMSKSSNEIDAVYVDGVSKSLTSQIENDNSGNFANSTLYFMSRAGSSNLNPGSLDDVRIYNRALTAAEIKSLHRMGR